MGLFVPTLLYSDEFSEAMAPTVPALGFAGPWTFVLAWRPVLRQTVSFGPLKGYYFTWALIWLGPPTASRAPISARPDVTTPFALPCPRAGTGPRDETLVLEWKNLDTYKILDQTNRWISVVLFRSVFSTLFQIYKCYNSYRYIFLSLILFKIDFGLFQLYI